jgi:hypothetical protein
VRCRWNLREAMNGAVTLRLLGADRRIMGGPFNGFSPPAIGVCLEVHSRLAHLADVLIDVPDFTPPTQAQLHDGLLRALRRMHAAPDLPVYVGCAAGLGRTGTFIAAMARLAGIEAAVAWTRAHYDARAVETPAQEAAVAALDVAAVWAAYAAQS